MTLAQQTANLIAEIQARPELHQHTYWELIACCERVVPGVMDLNVMEAHRAVHAQRNSRGKCDVYDGPCACGAWHNAGAR